VDNVKKKTRPGGGTPPAPPENLERKSYTIDIRSIKSTQCLRGKIKIKRKVLTNSNKKTTLQGRGKINEL